VGWLLSLERVGRVMADHAIPSRCDLRQDFLMSSNELETHGSATADLDTEGEKTAESKRKLDISVEITDTGPCKKHLKITIPRAEIDRHFQESLDTFRRDAAVPGFRPGRAPKELIIKRFRKPMSEQVKSTLLRSSLEQIDAEHKLDPISQPTLDVDAIELPEQGPMNIEMDLEVRPQFEVPSYKGLQVRRPVMEIPESEVDIRVTRFLERHGQLVPKLEGGAELGDTIIADLAFARPDGRPINEVKEVQFRLQPELRFQNGTAPNIGQALLGVRPGESRTVDAQLGTAVADATLRGQPIKMEVRVSDLKRFRLPEIDQEFLQSIGFDSMEELREAIRALLKRQFKAEQGQVMRRQILDVLLRQTPFDLPPELVAREEKNTIARLVDQLKREGMSEEQIRARAAEIRANAQETTLRSLKEFLLLAKIADAEGIKVEEDDVSHEIEAIAERTDESARRVRARIEKDGSLDSLVTQILEAKVISHILRFAVVEDLVIAPEPPREVETLDHTADAPAPAQEEHTPDGTSPE
jgi:trigger factor